MVQDDTWPFDQPRNCAVFTISGVLDGSEPILHVTHDEDDHSWQFLGSGDAQVVDAKLVSLESIVRMDPTVLELADLPPGWRAWRENAEAEWTREPKA
jgi:hypothetical protein